MATELSEEEKRLQIEALEASISAQGATVKEIKGNVDASPEAKKAEIDKLLALKNQLAILKPPAPKKVKEKKKPAGPTKKQLRMMEREKKAAEERAQAEKVAAASADMFGVPPVLQSQAITDRTWTRIETLNESMVGQKVWVRGRVHTCRDKGRAAFLLLRQGCYTVQAVLFQSATVPKEMIRFAGKVTNESVVDVCGVITAVDQAVESATQSLVEVSIEKIFTISEASPNLPFQLDDASRPDEVEEGKESNQAAEVVGPRVGMDTRLNYRCIDLRTPANQAIMRVQGAVSQLFREFMTANNFMEMHTPKLLAGASEGGSSVFELKYFGEDACLAQSPQFYKQMVAACAGFERVFEIGPVFRAENSNTHRHLCEFTGLDFEMVIDEHYYEVLDLFGQLFNYIFEGLNTRFAKELATINTQHPFEPLTFLKPALRITFAEGIALLREAGVTEEEQGSYDDLSTPVEKKLGKLVKEKYGTDFFMMDKYPLAARPFYTMPCPENPLLSNSYDMFIRGEEIVSGAQRIHDADMILQRAAALGVPAESINYYVDTFRHGCLPHGGGGIGLERVVMLFLGLPNIRKASMFPRDPTRLAP